jgi:VanZ family protein
MPSRQPGTNHGQGRLHRILEGPWQVRVDLQTAADRLVTPSKIVLLVRFLTVFAGVIATVLLLGPFHAPPGWDKLAHGTMFYGLTLLALVCLPWNRKGEIVVALIAIGGASEIAQHFTGRDMSLFDWLADAAGVIVAAAPVYVARLRQIAQQAEGVVGPRSDRRAATSAIRERPSELLEG